LGGGIEDIAAGATAKLAFAYHQNGNGDNSLSTRRLSARLYDIEVNPNGKLEGELVYLTGSTAQTGPTAPNEGSGWALFLEHTQSGILGGGFNKLAFVYGADDAAGGNWNPTYSTADDGRKGAKEYRIIDQLYVDLKNGWSGMATVLYSDVKDAAGNKTKWFSIGARPQYNFTPNVSVAVEGGFDQVKSGGNTAKLAKLTVAPQYTLSGGFWARPAFRAFATYAKWNDAANGAGTGTTFGTKTNGMTYGLQVEAWW
jgi:maltoporin